MPRLRLPIVSWIVVALLLGVGLEAACAGAPACELNSDCHEGRCVDGECVVECRDAALDCPEGHICNSLGECEYVGSSGGQGGTGGTTTTTTSSSSGGMGGTGTGGTTTTTTGGSGGGTVAKIELDVCGSDAECGGALVCKLHLKGGAQRCTRACASHDQCMSGTRCIDDGSGTFCLGSDIGRSCTDPSPCNSYCLQGPNFCTDVCSSGSDCPNGYGCRPVGSPATNVCVRVEALCDSSDTSACTSPSECDETAAMILGGCTLLCGSPADCPQRAVPLAPWTCDGFCRRPPDVYGPLAGGWFPTEWHCDGMTPVVLCNDAQHIDFVNFDIPDPPANVDCFSQMTTTGAANDACVNSCRYAGGCADGFACVGVGSVNGQRIGLCLRSGSGEPGTNCSNNTQCKFGYCVSGTCSRDCSADGICPAGLSCVNGGSIPVEGMAFRRCE